MFKTCGGRRRRSISVTEGQRNSLLILQTTERMKICHDFTPIQTFLIAGHRPETSPIITGTASAISGARLIRSSKVLLDNWNRNKSITGRFLRGRDYPICNN